MIYSQKLVSSAFIIGSLAFSGCALNKMVKAAKDQELTVNPNPLEVHADTVKFDMSAKLPTKLLRKNKTYTINTVYAYGDQRENLGDVVFKAADFPNSKKENPTQSQTFAFGYKPEMRNGNLIVKGIASNANGKQKATPDMPVAKGVVTTSKLVQDYFYFAYADHGYNTGEELQPTYVEFYFPQGSSKLQTRETGGKSGKQLDAFIASKNVTRTVSITGSHSPEGTETVNADLADDRAKAIEKYYRGRMKRLDYKTSTPADSIDFVTKAVVQDWTSLKEELEKPETKLTQEQKQEIISIIDGGSGDFIEKEKQLKNLSSYRYLYNEIYPRLRIAETEILTVMPKKTDAEISALSKGITEGSQSADKLTKKELAYAATLTPILTEREAIYNAAIKKEDSWEAHNNMGVVLLEQAYKELDQAKRNSLIDRAMTHFEISKNKQETPEVYTNRAVASLMRGNATSQTIQDLNQALSLNPSEEIRKGINGVKGVLEIKGARYADATNSLSSAKDHPTVLYNRGLAQLLNKEYDKANASFDEAIAADNKLALAYYAKAQVAARQKNEQAVASNVREAISRDSSLRERALEDVLFSEWAQSQAFREAVR